MSRRQSRISVDGRQNDALLEFETFKKKFLLANKHITKLNSTLSVRIEELNAQISILQVENLRLRASEIALASQLKKEREKSRKILNDAETATHVLMKQLGHIRKSFHVPHKSTSPEPEPLQAPPRARRPPIDPNASPPANRIARPPTISGIFEEEEEEAIEDVDYVPSPTPLRRKSKSRSSSSGGTSSSSRLPLLSHAAPPATDDLLDFDDHLLKAGKKKPTRRQSGLLTTTMSITTVTPNGLKTELIAQRPPSPAFGSPLRRSAGLEEAEEELLAVTGAVHHDDEDEQDEEPIALSVTKTEKLKRHRDKEDAFERDSVNGGKKERERRRLKDTDGAPGPSSYEGKKPKLKDVTNSPPPRPYLATIDSTHERERQRTPINDIPSSSASSSNTARTFLSTPFQKSSSASHLPTPRSSSPTLPSEPEVPAELPTGNRERRVRKSINYAEPKLNTKMRKPDPPPPPPSAMRRPSSASDTAPRRSIEGQGASITSSSSGDSTGQPQPVAGVKRKKSRAHVQSDDGDESDGTQADGEYGGGIRAASATGWVSIEGRRRSVAHSSSHARRVESDEGRRHSMAV